MTLHQLEYAHDLESSNSYQITYSGYQSEDNPYTIWQQIPKGNRFVSIFNYLQNVWHVPDNISWAVLLDGMYVEWEWQKR